VSCPSESGTEIADEVMESEVKEQSRKERRKERHATWWHAIVSGSDIMDNSNDATSSAFVA